MEKASLIQWGTILEKASDTLTKIMNVLSGKDVDSVKLLHGRVIGHLFTMTHLITAFSDPEKARQTMLERYSVFDTAEIFNNNSSSFFKSTNSTNATTSIVPNDNTEVIKKNK